MFSLPKNVSEMCSHFPEKLQKTLEEKSMIECLFNFVHANEPAKEHWIRLSALFLS